MTVNLTGLDELRACLASILPLELKGMELLRGQPHRIGAIAPVPRSQVVEAVTEIVAYTERCGAAARSLATLAPIPVLTALVMEFGV
jgi:hypothetical protein